MVEIGKPDRETRLEIIKQKAVERRLTLSQGDIEYVADRITGSVRQLEGVLNKLKVFAAQKPEICVRDVMEGIPLNNGNHTTPEKVIEKVTSHYHVDQKLVMGKGRTKQVMIARQVTMHILCNRLGLSTTQVGRIMGRDHSTVCYALQSVVRKMESDQSFADEVSSLL